MYILIIFKTINYFNGTLYIYIYFTILEDVHRKDV